jgi:hypothetical protein
MTHVHIKPKEAMKREIVKLSVEREKVEVSIPKIISANSPSALV